MNRKFKKKNLVVVTAVMTALLAVMTLITLNALKRYEDGIVAVCATQQDSYVQLVIDQINLKENRSNEEIIQNILSTLDASTNRYWVFSQDQSLLFVKDTLETNKYQSFKTDYYYTEKSSEAFVNSLKLNVVQHAEIVVNKKEYIASGVKFDYGGKEYRLCLLTNRSVLLDNNTFLQAKVELSVLLFGVYFLLYIIPIISVSVYNSLVKRLDESEKENYELNGKLVRLNHRMDNGIGIESKGPAVFDISTVPEFLSKLEKKEEAFPLGFSLYAYGSERNKIKLMHALDDILDKRDVRFEDKAKKTIAIISMKTDLYKMRHIGSLDSECDFLGFDILNGIADVNSDIYSEFQVFLELKFWALH
ncbi:MAG: hypothetical protein J6O71_03510 [Lachnospiraceae bacterium]|nr:hypothetical protein [Lachnospiraceae bacterium]